MIKKGEIDMEVKDIIDNLDRFDNELLDDIIEQITNVKQKRKENECYELVNKLNELLKPISDIVKYLEEQELGSDIGFLVTNEFKVEEDCDGNYYVVLD
jgi:hypothetical protein